MADFHSKSIEEVFKLVGSGADGLTEIEADKRLKQNGPNKLPEIKKQSLIVRFFKQFKDIMIIILLAAAAASLFIGLFAPDGHSEVLDFCIISGIVVLNAVLGLIQEIKAENAMESLKSMSQPHITVVREGTRRQIKIEELVAGDMVVLNTGDIVPADIRLVESASLKCDEASLTGESVASEKHEELILPANTPVADRENICYSGSTVVYGRGVGVVIGTGADTEIGKIAGMLNSRKQEPTPLEKTLSKLGFIITLTVLSIVIVIFTVNIIIKPGEALNSFLTAVALAVAAIPEALPAVVTIILSFGVIKLARKNVIIKKLQAVETLGCCEVICSDKTGTITQNKMTVREIFINGHIMSAGRAPAGDKAFVELVHCMLLCNDGRPENGGFAGDPTETALLNYGALFNAHKAEFDIRFVRVGELPFDSGRKLMSTANLMEGKTVIYTKGAPDEILKICKYIFEGGIKREIAESDREKIKRANSQFAGKAFRVLGFAEKLVNISTEGITEENLTFLGLAGMLDPPREEVYEALTKCRQAGLRAVMITGDHRDTAYAIAKELKMLKSGSEVAEGSFLDNFTDEQLKTEINKYSVFARVSPLHKVRIVRALRANGKVVAMTGDGVNDAPGIKAASIGIGMGITGTEVTKEVADMVLTDDNFATIIVGIEEGRKIFTNIQKTIQFLLSSNIAEVAVIFVLTFIYPQLIILWAVQLLFVNLVTDSLPALAIGVEEAEQDVMAKPPRPANQNIIFGKTGFNILYQGLAQSVIVGLVFIIGLSASPAAATTMAFIAMNCIKFFHMFNVRTEGSVFKSNPFKNKMLLAAFGIGFAMLALVCLVPGLAVIFKVTGISLTQWVIAVGLPAMIIPVCEVVKLMQRAAGHRYAGNK